MKVCAFEYRKVKSAPRAGQPSGKSNAKRRREQSLASMLPGSPAPQTPGTSASSRRASSSSAPSCASGTASPRLTSTSSARAKVAKYLNEIEKNASKLRADIVSVSAFLEKLQNEKVEVERKIAKYESIMQEMQEDLRMVDEARAPQACKDV